jgi:hypothetical protein
MEGTKMRRFKAGFIGIMLTVLLLVFVGQALAAATGSCTVSTDTRGYIQSITWTCTGDGSGTFAATGFASPATRGWVYVVDTYPGGTAANGGGFTLLTSDTGVDVLGGNGGSTLAAAARSVAAKSGWVNGTLQPVITGNTTASATFTIKAWIWKTQ